MLSIRTRLGPSLIHGIGCFAMEDIQAGQLVWKFDFTYDMMLHKGHIPGQLKDLCSTHSYEPHEGMHILCCDNARFINHSDNPNMISSGNGEDMMAARDIKSGEELTENYNHYPIPKQI